MSESYLNGMLGIFYFYVSYTMYNYVIPMSCLCNGIKNPIFSLTFWNDYIVYVKPILITLRFTSKLYSLKIALQ